MIDPTSDVFLTSNQVRNRFGGVSYMWLYRRERDAGSGFPEAIIFAKRKLWRLSDLQKWEQSLATNRPRLGASLDGHRRQDKEAAKKTAEAGAV